MPNNRETKPLVLSSDPVASAAEQRLIHAGGNVEHVPLSSSHRNWHAAGLGTWLSEQSRWAFCFTTTKKRIIETIDSWLRQMCQEDKPHLFRVCRTLWLLEKDICMAFVPTLWETRVESGLKLGQAAECSFNFTDTLVQQSLYPWGCFFFFLQLYDSSPCLIQSLSEKVCGCRAATAARLTLSLDHCLPAPTVTCVSFHSPVQNHITHHYINKPKTLASM